jgi:hypothetical protein
MRLDELLDPIERAFFDAIRQECSSSEREILEDQMHRINEVARYEVPSRHESQTILYWKGWFRLRRDFSRTFAHERKEERLAQAVIVLGEQRTEVAVGLLSGAIAYLTFRPRRIDAAPGDPAPRVESLRLFPDRD